MGKKLKADPPESSNPVCGGCYYQGDDGQGSVQRGKRGDGGGGVGDYCEEPRSGEDEMSLRNPREGYN